MSIEPPAPAVDDSRRLTGCNFFFDGPGAILETALVASDAVLTAWRNRVARARAALDWPDGPAIARTHAHGASLVIAAPLDQLYAATEANEWAWCSALRANGIAIGSWPDMPECVTLDDAQALAMLVASARAERKPALQALLDTAAGHGINLLVDDEQVSLGSGGGGRCWPIAELPEAPIVDWSALSDVPIALVTGSNGKTTTTRLLAALARAHGWRTAYTCTDGVFVDHDAIDRDDYSGPAGARLALRQTDIDAAILETARGGILRRGIAPQHADVAVVTNVSNDHFGDYGIDDLDALADVKLTVARPLGTRGTLVLNGDDALLLRHAEGIKARLALFALDADAPVLQSHRAGGGATAGVRAGNLVIERAGGSLNLGAVDAMPLTLGGAARYNIANIAAAALIADVLGIDAHAMRHVLATFGASRDDNPGRLERFALGDTRAFLDYAHNPDGMHGLLAAATRARQGRLGLLLGQAGDRGDHEIRELGAVVAAVRPDHVVLKDLPGYLRGREPGEVPAILRDALIAGGVDAACIVTELDEWQAVLQLLAWARPGDTLVFPVQGRENRPRASALLDALARRGWRADTPLPPDPDSL